jgi:hypothetical protein
MKAFRWLVLLALVAGYIAWPYHSTRKFEEAIKSSDAATAREMIDMEELRESFIRTSIDIAVHTALKTPEGMKLGEAAVREKAKSVYDNPALRKQLDERVNADGFVKMMISKKGGPNERMFGAEKWVSPVEFSVQEAKGESKFIFKLKGAGWKLCGADIPPSEYGKLRASRGSF